MYRIVDGVTAADLVEKVNAMLREGWTIAGGMSVAFCGNATFRFYQAMIQSSPPQQQPKQQDNKGK